MKILRQQGTRYGWREVALFPEDFFDSSPLSPGDIYHLFTLAGRLVAAPAGTGGMTPVSYVNGRLKFLEGVQPNVVVRADGRMEMGPADLPAFESGFFGVQGTGGGGNWGSGDNRAFFDRFPVEAGTYILKRMMVYMLQSNGTGAIKPLIYGNNISDKPGDQEFAGSSYNITVDTGGAGSPYWLEIPLGDVEITFDGGPKWLGVVGNNSGHYELGSSVHTAPQAVMFNGTFSFATPPATAPTHVGEPGPYSNDFAVYIEWERGIAVPAILVAPAITGVPAEESVISCSTGSWSGGATKTYGYQWYVSVSPVGGEVASSFTVRIGDEGEDIYCRVQCNNEAGSDYANANTVVGEAGGSYFEDYLGVADGAINTGGIDGSDGRALMSRFYLPYNATLIEAEIGWDTSGSAGDAMYKLVIADDAAGACGTSVYVSGAQGPAPKTANSETVIALSGSLAPGWYWVGIVTNSFQCRHRGAPGTNVALFNGTWAYANGTGVAFPAPTTTYAWTRDIRIKYSTTDPP